MTTNFLRIITETQQKCDILIILARRAIHRKTFILFKYEYDSNRTGEASPQTDEAYTEVPSNVGEASNFKMQTANFKITPRCEMAYGTLVPLVPRYSICNLKFAICNLQWMSS
jgi:hypothetical protein